MNRRGVAVAAAVVVAVSGCAGDGEDRASASATSTTAAPVPSSTTLVDFGETEGCPPEAWVENVSLWDDDGDIPMTDEGGLRPPQTLETAFSWRDQGILPWAGAHPDIVGYGSMTLLDALQPSDATGYDGAARSLLRTVAAAYLSAAYEGIQFPFRRYGRAENGNPPISQLLAEALAAGDEASLRALTDRLDPAIHLECPL